MLPEKIDVTASATDERYLSVHYWREQFNLVYAQVGEKWKSKLATRFPEIYDSYRMQEQLRSVLSGRAGLQITAQVVRHMSQLISEHQTDGDHA